MSSFAYSLKLCFRNISQPDLAEQNFAWNISCLKSFVDRRIQIIHYPFLGVCYLAGRERRYLSVIIGLLFLFLSSGKESQAQSIVDIIDRTNSATFTIVAQSPNSVPLDTARAFFISADGLAITSASVLRHADTLVVTDYRNRQMTISRVIAIHPYANLALIQVANSRNREISFLIPSRNTFDANGEILVFSHESNKDKGLSYGVAEKILHPFYLGRSAVVSLNAGNASRGAPIINSAGEFVGIYSYIKKSEVLEYMLSVHIIDDKKWVSVNQIWYLFRQNKQKEQLTAPFISEGLYFQAKESWLESARSFNEAVKLYPTDAQLYALRSMSRYNYGNNTGGKDDFTYATTLNPNEPLPYLARALFHIKNRQYNYAANDLLVCVEKEDEYAMVYYLLGQLQVINNEVRKAFASYSYAIQLDSLYDGAYYERGRLMLQHSTNQSQALEDLLLAARLNPSLTGVYTLIGNIRLSRNDYLGAITDYDMALRIHPDDVHALMNRGMAYFNTGLKQKACEDWGRAGKLGNTQAFKLISRHCSQLR